MGKTLWIVNHYAKLPSEPGGTRHYWLGQGLQRLGWDVRLIRCHSTHASRPWVPEVVDVDGLEVTNLVGPPSSSRGLKRIRGWTEFSALVLTPTVTRHLPKPDLVVGSTVHLGAAWAARALARRHETPFVFEVRDLWPETLIATGALKHGSTAARMMLKLEGTLAHSASLIVSPLAGVGQYMSETHGIPADRFVWVSNGVNFDYYRNVPPPSQGGLKLQYFGSIGRTNGVGSILDSVREANRSLEESAQLQLIGFGPDRDPLMRRVTSDPQLAPLVSFPPAVPSEEVSKAMAWGNALILSVRDLPNLYRYGISMNKLFDYLASGRWIVMDYASEWNPIADAPALSQSGRGRESMASAIIKLAQLDPRERDRAAQANRVLAENRFEYAVLAGELATHLDKAVSNP